MKVESEVLLGYGHSLEFGRATWGDDYRSVRNRYPRSDGGFSPHSSSEIPIEDVALIVVETLRRDLLGQEQTILILRAAVDSISRCLAASDVAPPETETSE